MGIPPPIELANLGMADSLILMVMALVVFGPRRLPQIGRQIGKLMYEFRKASNDFKFQMEEELRLAEEADRRKKEEADRQRAAALAPSVQPALGVSADPAVAPHNDTPVQSVESQADIGAAEPSTTSASPGETTDPSQYAKGSETQSAPAASGAEPAAVENTILPPRVKPPTTGEQVAASRPVPPARYSSGPETKSDSNGSDSAHTAAPPEAAPSESTPPTEPVSQHG
jgi:sec-independent protein translocase protein TatB